MDGWNFNGTGNGGLVWLFLLLWTTTAPILGTVAVSSGLIIFLYNRMNRHASHTWLLASYALIAIGVLTFASLLGISLFSNYG